MVVPSGPQAEERVRRDFWRKLRRVAGRIPFAEEAVSAYFCAADPRTPHRVRVVLIGALAYFVVPADMIPDFIAGLGFTDDATVMMAAVTAMAPHIADRHRQRARRFLDRAST
ncbi:MAG: DUF1232 domain-containing protein [Alphaproteobacteria bacterium]|nr:DUF1232 domain-containing protein [Alphaproteobacteria bacterium]